MDENWTLGKRLIGLLRERLDASEIADITVPGTSYYPTIMWSENGVLERPGHPPETVPAHYGLGLMETGYQGKMVRIPSEDFGFILFHPKKEDQNSANRLIDYDGTDIVVR